jgi:tetratricopeptide (TPR) repeat protein
MGALEHLNGGRCAMLRTACVSLWLALIALPAGAADAARLDLESRIQYSYYTEDLHALQNLVDSLQSDTKTDALHGYYVGLANYRLALLYVDRAPDKAKSLLERCVSGLDESLKAQPDFPDALALQAACLHRLGELTALAVPLAGHRSGSEMRRALELAPKNPRVLLLEAIEVHTRPQEPPRGGPLATLQQALAAFEVERAGPEVVPSWGEAEAYAFLARGYLAQGDAIAARGALEHALLMAPDFVLAHRLMKRITDG